MKSTLKICLVTCLLLVGCTTSVKVQENQGSQRLVLVAGAENQLPKGAVLEKPSTENMRWKIEWNNVTHEIGCEKNSSDEDETVLSINNTSWETQKGTVVCMYFLGDSQSLNEGIVNNKSLGVAFFPNTCDMVATSTQKVGGFYTLPSTIMETCLSVIVDNQKEVEKDPVQEDTMQGMPLWCYGQKNINKLEIYTPSGEAITWEKRSPAPCPTLSVVTS